MSLNPFKREESLNAHQRSMEQWENLIRKYPPPVEPMSDADLEALHEEMRIRHDQSYPGGHDQWLLDVEARIAQWRKQ